MSNAVILGSGLVGAVIADDLCRGPGSWSVTVADRSPDALAAAVRRCPPGLQTVELDLADRDALRRTIESADLVLGAVPSQFGRTTLRTVIEAGKPYCDITFMPENALEFDALARDRGVTAIVDCGVAPGMSNLLAARGVAMLDRAERVEILVGGLPVERHWPFEYKAGFAPGDVIEEYTRPARLVEHGDIVVREALSEPELIAFDGIGTLEAFNTDGLRSIADTLDVPFMRERTLRYPGHIEIMRVLRSIGLFGTEPVRVGDAVVRPRDLLAQLMFPQWTYDEGERDLTVMRVEVIGARAGRATTLRWDLLDELDPATNATSMARTTGFPCAIVGRMIARGRIDRPGVAAPEALGHDEALVAEILADLGERGVNYTFREV